MLIVFGIAVVVVLPALGFLYTLAQRSMLDGEAERGSPRREGVIEERRWTGSWRSGT